MTMLDDVKTVLFDLDGTLTDYQAGSMAGLRAALKVLNAAQKFQIDWETFLLAYNSVIEAESAWTGQRGFKVPAHENRMRRFRILLDSLGLPSTSHLSEMADAYGIGRSSGTSIFPDVHQVLKALKPKYKLGILSEGSSKTQLAQIDLLKINDYFSAIVISDQTPWHKPDELLYRFAAMKLESEPEEIVMIGDRLDWDIKPARETGMKTVFVNRARIAEDDDRIDLYADKVIYGLQELLTFL